MAAKLNTFKRVHTSFKEKFQPSFMIHFFMIEVFLYDVSSVAYIEFKDKSTYQS